jgi:hypothetical protein
MPHAHPTIEHFAPIFGTLGAVAKPDDPPGFTLERCFYGLSKRFFVAGWPARQPGGDTPRRSR